MFDIIGDVHGCYEELVALTRKLGYEWSSGVPLHPDGRKLVFPGDLTDRGEASLAVIQVVAELVKQGAAHYCPGNHCDKLYRYMLGRNVQVKHGLETTIAEFEALSEEERTTVEETFMTLYEEAPLYLSLDDGKLIAAHAGIRERYIGRDDKNVKRFVLYGDITGEKHANGLPVRKDWALEYSGKSLVVYGHTPVRDVRWVGETVNIDTGCVFGGKLSALRYPERETVSVPSSKECQPEKFETFNANT